MAKLKLKFVNKGEPFNLPDMTVERQDEWLNEIIKVEKKMKNKEKRDKYLNRFFLLKTLQLVDNGVTMDDITKMHPGDFIKLSTMAWEQGRELVDDDAEDFR